MHFIESTESSKLVPMAFLLGQYGEPEGALVSRDSARRARQALEWQAHSHAAAGPAPIALDFADVFVVSTSFADEFFSPLLAGRIGGYYEEHPILALNLTDEVIETLDEVLRHRRLHLLAVTEQGPILLGGDDLLWQTFEAALDAGQFRAAELAQRLRISPQAMNNRLKTLVQSGALRRVRSHRPRGGKEFSYIVPALRSYVKAARAEHGGALVPSPAVESDAETDSSPAAGSTHR